MRRLSGVLMAGAILLLPAFSQQALAQTPPQKTTYEGDIVIAAYAVNTGKDADYEKVIATLKDALGKSPRPEAKQQLEGWKVVKNSAKQPDGSSLYVHVITPVVKDADYSITNIVYVSQGDLTASNPGSPTVASTQVQITFTTDLVQTVTLIAWGGHIASSTDWSPAPTAGNINGSPYHTRLVSWSLGNVGQQDHQLSADAVDPPCSNVDCNDNIPCTIDACDVGTGMCTHTADDSVCSDGQFCNGTETCNVLSGCQAGTPVNCCSEAFNIRAGHMQWFPPRMRPKCDQGQTTIVVRLMAAPADSLTMSGTLFVREL